MQHIFQYVPGINQLAGEEEHPPPSGAEDKKKGVLSPLPLYAIKTSLFYILIYDKKTLQTLI
jgi:hypothetical protein